MSFSTILIHQGPSLSLKLNVDRNFGKQRRKVVVCCCPWSGSDMENKKNTTSISNFKGKNGVPAEHDNTTTSTKNSVGNTKNNFPFPFNFISYLLSLGPLSTIFNKGRKLPPTPSILHLIGVSRYLLQSRPLHYPLADLAKIYGPLMYLVVGERAAAVVSSARIAKEVLSTHADRPETLGSQLMLYKGSGVFFHEYDEHWKQMRNLCMSELLSNKKVGSFEHVREAESSAMIQSIRSGGVAINLTEKIFMYTFTVSCKAMFGRVAVDKSEALRSIRKLVELLGRGSVVDLFPSIKALNFISWQKRQMEKSRRELDTLVEALIDIDNRDTNGGDEHFIDVLLRFKETADLPIPLTDDIIKALILDLIVGGTDTTPAAVDWAMAELMKNPRVMVKAQDEIRQAFEGKTTILECELGRLKYLKLVIMETLRLYPSLSIILRSCPEEVKVDGYHLPPNAPVIINTWAIGRDPMYWKNPESFEPERFEAKPVNFSGSHIEYIPFGSGRRMCPGKTFGLATFEMILAQLLYHFDWELPGGIKPDDLDMTSVGGIAVFRKTPLYLIAKPYHPAPN